MKRLSLCLAVSCLFGMTGCESLDKKPKEEQSAFQAPGIDQLQQLMRSADTLYQTKEYKKSKNVYLQIAKLDPKNLKAQYRLGNIAFRGRDWQEAVKRYQTVVALEPRHIRAQHNLAMTHLTLAERHLKFYAANVDSDANLDAVTKLVTALEDISDPRASERRAKTSDDDSSSLDLLLDELAR